jgi:hypothetical protein
MEVPFTPAQEAKLAQLANSAGTRTERLVKDAALRLLPRNGHGDTPKAPQSTRTNPRQKRSEGIISPEREFSK